MSKKKVLVIGGTGIAGQFITDYLLHYHDICELFIASRGIHKISEKKVKFIKMDIHDTQNIESVIKQFDMIIVKGKSIPDPDALVSKLTSFPGIPISEGDIS